MVGWARRGGECEEGDERMGVEGWGKWDGCGWGGGWGWGGRGDGGGWGRGDGGSEMGVAVGWEGVAGWGRGVGKEEGREGPYS